MGKKKKNSFGLIIDPSPPLKLKILKWKKKPNQNLVKKKKIKLGKKRVGEPREKGKKGVTKKSPKRGGGFFFFWGSWWGKTFFFRPYGGGWGPPFFFGPSKQKNGRLVFLSVCGPRGFFFGFKWVKNPNLWKRNLQKYPLGKRKKWGLALFVKMGFFIPKTTPYFKAKNAPNEKKSKKKELTTIFRVKNFPCLGVKFDVVGGLKNKSLVPPAPQEGNNREKGTPPPLKIFSFLAPVFNGPPKSFKKAQKSNFFP